MKRKIKNTVALLCAAALLLGMCSMFALAAGNPVYSNIDNLRDDLGADISVMSFNVLQYNSGQYLYANNSYTKRLNTVVSIITAYDPDIIGIQEAGTNNDFDWPAQLVSKLGTTYGYVRLDQQSGGPDSLSIAKGLIIFYRKSRFTALSNGCENFNLTVSSGGYSRTDTSRWYQWVKLKDNTFGKELYMFNSHFAINSDVSGSSDANDVIIGKMLRTQQAKILSNKIHSLSADLPFFSTADYNCNLTVSEEDDAAGLSYNQLCQMSVSPHAYIKSSIRTADLTLAVSTTTIDHIFLHTSLVDALKTVGIRESAGGITASDHFPYITYCNYRANATITPGTYDKNTGTHTDTASTNSYTYKVTPGSRLSYKIYDAAGNLCTATVELKSAINKFEIRFYNSSSGTLYDTIDSTIYYDGADKPILQAENAVNHYFANNAYQVVLKKANTDVILSFSDGTLYTTEACTTKQNGHITGLPTGKTTYYLKTSDGDIFPVNIYRESYAASTDAKTYYIDDDIGSAIGTVAFWNGAGVCLIQGQSKGFDALIDVRSKVNAGDGCTLYMAPGDYDGTATNTFTSSVTILGSNAGRSPHIRYVNDVWTHNTANRREETVIHGDLCFSVAGASPVDYITVQGIKFVGESDYGAIYVSEKRSADGKATTDFITELDIQYNIFEGWGTQSNASAVWANAASQKRGIIANNYFNCTNFTTVEGKYCRAIFARNLNGMIIESNRFINYELTFWISSEVTSGVTTPGYAVYTVSGNRFEYCHALNNYIRNMNGDTKADIRYIDNTFVRCGYTSPMISINCTETSATSGNDFSKCRVDILSNRFLGTMRAIGFYRSHKCEDKTTTLTGDLSQMTVNMNQNVFYDPMERSPTNSTYETFNSPGTCSVYFNFVVKNTGALAGALGSKWSLSHNYFYSHRVDQEYNSPAYNNPDLYICNYYNKDGTEGKSFSTTGKFAPYYTTWSNNTLSNLSNGSALGTISGVTATSYEGVYDGEPHSITVTAPSGATVSYSTNGEGGVNAAFQATNPAYTTPGTRTVAYRVTQPGYTTIYGSATVTITKGASTRTTVANQTVTYAYGTEYKLDEFTDTKEGDTLTYTYNGATYDTMPAFTEVGVYKVSIKVTNANYNTFSQTATLTIQQASLADVTLTGGYEGAYDGASHTISISGAPADVLPLYSVDGGDWTATKPSYKEVTDGAHTVTVKLSNPNYVERTETFTYNITPASLSDVTLTPVEGLTENGTEFALVNLSGAATEDTVLYALDGHAFTKTVPTARKAGTYQVAVKISRANYTDKLLMTTVTIAEGTSDLPDLFDLRVDRLAVTDDGNDSTYAFNWNLHMAYSATGAATAESADFKVTAFGIKYAATKENVEEYLFLQKYGLTDKAAAMETESKIASINFTENEAGITTLYSDNTFHIQNTKPLKARYAVSFIRYTLNGVEYEEYSIINAISNLPGSDVSTLGDTVTADDLTLSNAN